jgi:uncharacterized protein (DUF2126 family)
MEHGGAGRKPNAPGRGAVQPPEGAYAPTGLAHFGQGKWYPGEPLPRWSLNCFWRRDGEPIWENPELLANEKTNYGATATRAAAFWRAWRSGSGCRPCLCSPLTRTPSITCGRSAGCPRMSTRSIRATGRPGERARLARIFEQGLDAAVGYVLPVARNEHRHGLADGPLVPAPGALLPGARRLAVGLAVAAGQLPWALPGDIPHVSCSPT